MSRNILILSCSVLVIAAFISLFMYDAAVATYFKSQYGSWFHEWARATTDVAKAGPYFAICGGLWVVFMVRRRLNRNPDLNVRRRRYETLALFGLLSFVTSGIFVQGLKHAFGRKRPYADAALSSHEFHPFTANYEFHSMPSGHSQVLFTAAAVLTYIWPRGWWFWMGNAMVFALTRVITLNHWLSDILAGAAVGILGTALTYKLMRRRKDHGFSVDVPALVLALFLIVAAPIHHAKADAPGPFGIGLVIGDPTGLSMAYKLSQQRSIDGAIAWSFGRDPGFKIHSDYLWHREGVLRAEKVSFDLHYGAGARIWSLSNKHHDNLRIGPRFPVGSPGTELEFAL